MTRTSGAQRRMYTRRKASPTSRMFIWRTAETYRPHAIQLKEALFVNMPLLIRYSTIRSYQKALEELLDYIKEREQIWLGQ